MTRWGLAAKRTEFSPFHMNPEPNPPLKGDYQPVCFSRPKEGERYEDWVERLIEALDKQGVFKETQREEG